MKDLILEENYSAWLPSEKNEPILDLGCGDGRILHFLSIKGYNQILGVDRDID